jgi:hypothetical protein
VINDQEEMRLLLRRGAEGLITGILGSSDYLADSCLTDRTDLAFEVLAELGLRSPEQLGRHQQAVRNLERKEFYRPATNPQEVHTCATLLCSAAIQGMGCSTFCAPPSNSLQCVPGCPSS